MFTGIVEELGTVVAAGTKLEVRCSTVLSDLSVGASIAVNGVCLTAVAVTAQSFMADLAPETLSRSNLADLVTGSRVNLERPVTPVTRLSGHIVQGHVDATGEVVGLDALRDGNWWLKVRVPKSLDRYVVEKGSITLDGISLTIAAVDQDVIGVTVIPHTFANTTIGQARVGSRMNIEVDVLAKHVEKLIAGSRLG
ncbi:MAG: riboflavin synthase [Acidobacteriia bacterium]|nr:riboflavin synthase [Terriglobia bacterium]